MATKGGLEVTASHINPKLASVKLILSLFCSVGDKNRQKYEEVRNVLQLEYKRVPHIRATVYSST